MPALTRGWSLASSAALALLLAVALVSANRGILALEVFEIGDPAANALLVQDAKAGRLLTGHYSRFGFHHPGPALLYTLAGGEILFHDLLGWTRSPATGHALAVLLHNAAWCGVLLWLLSRMMAARLVALAGMGIFLAITILVDGQYLVSVWFPYLYYWPFAVFTLGVARLSSGHPDSLWTLALAAGELVHGHASFAAIVALMGAGAALAYVLAVRSAAAARGWRDYLAGQTRAQRGNLLATVLIAVAFALPLALNTILNYPGDIPKYFEYGRGAAGHGWREALLFAARYWSGDPLLPLLGGALLLAMIWLGPGEAGAATGGQRELRGFAWSVILASGAVVLYAKTAVDDLSMRYVALFYFAAVSLTLVVAACWLLLRMGRAALAAATALLLLSAIFVARNMPPAGVESSAEIPGIAAALEGLGGKPVVLDLDGGGDWRRMWSTVAGLASHDKRLGRRAFCVNMNWRLPFTERYRCDANDLRTGLRVVATPRSIARSEGDGVVEVAGLRFVPDAPAHVRADVPVHFTEANLVQASRILGEGWSMPEQHFTWSVALVSTVGFTPDRAPPFELLLDLGAFLPREDSTQRLEVRAAGRSLGSFDFTSKANWGERSVRVPAEAAAADGRVMLELRVRSIASPSGGARSGDPRELGVGLRSLRVRPRE